MNSIGTDDLAVDQELAAGAQRLKRSASWPKSASEERPRVEVSACQKNAIEATSALPQVTSALTPRRKRSVRRKTVRFAKEVVIPPDEWYGVDSGSPDYVGDDGASSVALGYASSEIHWRGSVAATPTGSIPASPRMSSGWGSPSWSTRESPVLSYRDIPTNVPPLADWNGGGSKTLHSGVLQNCLKQLADVDSARPTVQHPKTSESSGYCGPSQLSLLVRQRIGQQAHNIMNEHAFKFGTRVRPGGSFSTVSGCGTNWPETPPGCSSIPPRKSRSACSAIAPYLSPCELGQMVSTCKRLRRWAQNKRCTVRLADRIQQHPLPEIACQFQHCLAPTLPAQQLPNPGNNPFAMTHLQHSSIHQWLAAPLPGLNESYMVEQQLRKQVSTTRRDARDADKIAYVWSTGFGNVCSAATLRNSYALATSPPPAGQKSRTPEEPARCGGAVGTGQWELPPTNPRKQFPFRPRPAFWARKRTRMGHF